MKTNSMFFTVAILLAAVSPAKAQNKMDSTVKTVYTCPMHPEVQSDKPGKCPKCGMTLVAKKVTIARKKESMKMN